MSALDTPELQALRTTVTDFTATEILPYQERWEESGRVPRELHTKAAALDLIGAGFPEDVGGLGGGVAAASVVCEALMEAGAAGGIYSALLTSGIALPHIIAAGSKELIDTWVRPTIAGEKIGALGITEPTGGSDVGHLLTSAARDGDDYVINGEKTFITSGARADFVVTAVRTGGPGAAGVSLIVVPTDTPGFTVESTLDKHGWRCSDTAHLRFTDVHVPAANLVGREGRGFEYISGAFITERVALAVQAYSQAQRALDLAADWAKSRVTFGKPIAARESVQATLATMAQKIDAARVYTRNVIARYDALEPARQAGDYSHTDGGRTDMVAAACFAKNTAVECVEWVSNQAVQLFGGMGFMTGTEVERIYRDMRVLGIGGGTTQILTTLAAKRMGYTA